MKCLLKCLNCPYFFSEKDEFEQYLLTSDYNLDETDISSIPIPANDFNQAHYKAKVFNNIVDQEFREVTLSEVEQAFLLNEKGSDGLLLDEVQYDEARNHFNDSYKDERRRSITLSWNPRNNIYRNLKWCIGSVKLVDLHPWPCMQGLPEKYTNENIIEAARHVEMAHHTKDYIHNVDLTSIFESLYSKIKAIQQHASYIMSHFPLIVISSEEHFDYEPLKTKYPFGIDDGNVRALAYASLGAREVVAYYGYPIDRKNRTDSIE